MGQTVAASFQTPTLFLIATDLTKMQVDTNVSESDIGGIKDGNKAIFTVDAFPKRTFEGTVAQVRQSPQTVQNVVTYDVVVSVDNTDRALKPGMTAANRIVVDQRRDVLRVPSQAFRYAPVTEDGTRRSGTSGRTRPAAQARVWVLRDGKPVRVAVTAGLDDDTFTEIVKGELKAGDLVIITEQRTNSGKPAAPRLQLVTRPTAGKSTMTEPIIRLEHVTRTYHVGDIDVHALQDVSLTIDAGRIRCHHGFVGIR